MTHRSRCIAYLIVCGTLLANARAQTATVIPTNEAAAHVGEYATVEGVVAKLFTSKTGNTFLNIGAAYSKSTSNREGRRFLAGPLFNPFTHMCARSLRLGLG